MKRSILILFSFFFFTHIFAQNYQCLQSGVKHYFTNGNGYLRGIRIDSVKMMGDTVVYYPFHTQRGPYSTTVASILDSTGGSWLGKVVLQLSDGVFIFDDSWNDSVVIKTQASVGDYWTFYKDTSNLYYRATVISIDTMTEAGIFDTVKIIQINAYNGTVLVSSDSLSGMEIILSKNHGFFQVLDLYTFPYHLPNAPYVAGLDFYLDKSTKGSHVAGIPPSFNNAQFRLCSLYNPTYQQLCHHSCRALLHQHI